MANNLARTVSATITGALVLSLSACMFAGPKKGTRGHSGTTDTQNVPGLGERESQLHPSPLKAQALLLGARGGRGTHGGRGRGRTGRWAGRGYERARVLTGLEPEVLVGLQ